jgi:hypothetical protein
MILGLFLDGTADANKTIVHLSGVTLMNVEQRRSDTDLVKRWNRSKPCPGVTVSTTNRMWPALGANPGLRCKKRASNRLCYAMPWLRQLVAGLLPRKPGFPPVSVRMGFVMDRVAL